MMFNSRGNERPTSWALTDDILDRNIDQLDRETPRCNLSEEEEEEELVRSKLAMESQNATQSHQVPSSCVTKSWMPASRGKDSTSKQPLTGFKSQPINGTGSPFMKRGTRELKNPTSPQESSFPPSGVVMTATSTQPIRMGFTSPTIVQQITSSSMTSHTTQHAMHSHSSSQQASNQRLPIQTARAFPTVPISSPNSSIQGKPLGMVTPQMPNQIQPPKVVVSPQSPQMSTSQKYPTSSSSTRTTKMSSPSSMKKLPSQATKSSTSQTAAVAPQQKQQQQQPNSQFQQAPKQQQQQQQPAFQSKQQKKQPPFQQVQSFQGDPRLHLAYCHVPDCQGCRDAKKWSDDPAKKAQLIRQVEDEILLRSRELDSCWQEDELDCVRDFTDMDRRKEMTYAETSEEGIYKRVSDEIIKRPPIWHDDEVDSVKDFSDRKGHEGETSKVGSEEKVCLSPPWNEEDEDLMAREGVVMVHKITTVVSSTQTSSQPTQTTSVTSEKIDATVTISNYKLMQEEADSVKDYTSYNNGQELGSRIPSSERINFTPPWTPSGCQTPAEGVPQLTVSHEPQAPVKENQSQNSAAPFKTESTNSCGSSTTPAVDTSAVKMRDKSKRGRAAEKTPFVVPRFDDLEEDSVTDFSAPERKIQGLNSKIPSYEYIPFTPPWISHNNSGIQTPREYSNVPTVTPITVSSSTSVLSPSSLVQTSSSVIPQSIATSNSQVCPPVLDSFRAGRHFDAIYGDHSTTVDSIKNFSVGLIEETSRIPSSEQLCFTPPWLEAEDDHVESIGDVANEQATTSAQELTLEEQRAIEEEARKTGVEEAEAKAQEQRKSQTEAGSGNAGQDAVAAGPPGRDSGFCSEQDQKQKQQQQQQQEQQEQENAMSGNSIGKKDVPYDEDHQEGIPDQEKNDQTESPNHCWSSKESSGSNQTDISTVVNPATSVPITAPGSPDPDGSEASDDGISENEGHETGQIQRSSAQEMGASKNVSTVTQSAPVQPKPVNSSQGQFIHHSQSFNYPHTAMQQGSTLPSNRSFPRLPQGNVNYHSGSFDGGQQQNFKGSQVMGHVRPPIPYQNRPQGFSTEQPRPRIHVQPYIGHYEEKGQIMGSMQGHLRPQVHYGNQNDGTLQYKNQQMMPRQPMPHQMHQSLAHQNMSASVGHYMGQKPFYNPNQGPPLSYHQPFEHKGPMPRVSNVKSGQIQQGQMSQGQISQAHMQPGFVPHGQMQQGQLQQGQMPAGQISTGQIAQSQIPKGQMPQGHIQLGQIKSNPLSGSQMPQSQMPMLHGNRQQQQQQPQHHQQYNMDAFFMHGMMEERYSKAMQQGLQNMINMESGMNEEKNHPSSNQGQVRSISQLNLHSMLEPQKNSDNASVVSFSSVAASHQNLDTKVDMVSSLLSMLGTHDKDDVARTLLAMSSSTDSCSAMRQSGCLPLLIKLLHDPDYEVKGINWEARHRAGLALHNIINSGTVDRKGRREVRVLRLIEIVRAHSEAVLSGNMDTYQAHKGAPALRDHGPGPAVAALMKLSFEEEHKNTITELGGLQAISELLKVDSTLNGQCKDPYSITLRKYAGMALINLTYSDSRNKNSLLEMKGSLKAIIAGLSSNEEEDLVQVSAGILRNVSWKTDENGKKTLAELNTAQCLMSAVQHIRSEAAIRSVLSAVWNLSAHSPDNKEEICATPGSLKFLCYALNYRSPSRSLVIPENAGGIMRNISSHIAVKPDYRQILREHGCLKVLISHLRSPSTRVVSNSCGILWNLSARCIEDQELLWELGAVSMLKTLVHSKHKSISTSSASALRNLMAVKPGSSSTDNESHASFNFKRSNTLPGKARAQNSQNANIRTDRKYKSFFGRKQSAKEVPHHQSEATSLLKKTSNRGFATVPEDARKVHRKVKHGEPHFYADLYQDPPRRGITMPQAKDPTVVLYSSENAQSAQEGAREEMPMPYNGSRVERWNNMQNGNHCNCKHGGFQGAASQCVDTLQQGMRGMTIDEESPIIASQRLGSSSSSLSSCSPPSQPLNQQMLRINTDNSPLSVFRDRKSNPGLCLHRRSMSDTISEFGHPSLGQKPLHAVTDSELAKPEVSQFNLAGFRTDDDFAWYSNAQKSHLANRNREPLEMRELRPSYRNLRMIKRYEEVSHYETRFLSPYDDCPLSIAKDSVRFPHFSLGYRPTQDISPARPDTMKLPCDSTTPKVFVQETRYDVRQAFQRRSNETISSSVQGSREDLVKRCKHNHSGTNVWQCDCNETENVWIRKMREKKRSQDQGQSSEGQKSEGQKVNRSDSQKGSRSQGQGHWLEGQKPPGWPENQRVSRSDSEFHAAPVSYQNIIPQSSSYQFQPPVQPRIGSRGGLWHDEDQRISKGQNNPNENDIRTMPFYDDDNVFLGSDQRHHFQEKIISSPQGQYGIATPIKDPHMSSGPEVNLPDIKACDQSIPENSMEKSSVGSRPDENEGKKPLRSSLKSPSDGLKHKFRKKHITQRVVTSGEKKKSKGKDNVMVTSL